MTFSINVRYTSIEDTNIVLDFPLDGVPEDYQQRQPLEWAALDSEGNVMGTFDTLDAAQSAIAIVSEPRRRRGPFGEG